MGLYSYMTLQVAARRRCAGSRFRGYNLTSWSPSLLVLAAVARSSRPCRGRFRAAGRRRARPRRRPLPPLPPGASGRRRPAPPRPAARGRTADGAPTEATLGVPIYPGAQFITSYDAGRGQRFYIFGIGRVVRRSGGVLPDRAEAEGRADLRRAGDARVRRRQVRRRHDGVSAGRDDQGLPVGRVAGLSRTRNPAASPRGSRRSFRSCRSPEQRRARSGGASSSILSSCRT